MITAHPAPLSAAEAFSTDYRAHRHARVIDGDHIVYSCGCINEVHESTALRKVGWCEAHARERRDPATLDRAYFEGLGCIVDGIPQCARYISELREVLGRFKPRNLNGWSLEVGCGCSMYMPALIATHSLCWGIEPCMWAARWTDNTFDVAGVITADFGDVNLEPESFSTILAAHSLEHMPDAPGAIAKCARLLEPGGEFWVVIPDESDPLNPDHTFTFSAAALWRCLDAAGLEVMRLEKRRRIEREAFLYARARKP